MHEALGIALNELGVAASLYCWHPISNKTKHSRIQLAVPEKPRQTMERPHFTPLCGFMRTYAGGSWVRGAELGAD